MSRQYKQKHIYKWIAFAGMLGASPMLDAAPAVPAAPPTAPAPTRTINPPYPADDSPAAAGRRPARFPYPAPEDAPPEAPAAIPAPIPYPAGMSLPWRLIDIDAAAAAGAAPALERARTELAKAWLTNPVPLTAYLGAKTTITINAKRLTDQTATGQPQGAAAAPALAVEPAWCSVMDREVIFVTVADARTNRLLGSAHAAFAKGGWAQQAAKGDLAPKLAAQIKTLAQTALQRAAAAAPEDSMHAGIDLARTLTRGDEGSAFCLAQLLEEQLAPDFTLARALGGEPLALARRLLHQPPELLRPSRRLVLRFFTPADALSAGTPPPDAAALKAVRILPAAYRVVTSVVDSVFGKTIASRRLETTWQLTQGAGTALILAPDPAFRALLDSEKATLTRSDLPEAAKIDRAWVYLDRGRAWGLKMNDRLVADLGGGEKVKGHVVRFFGPEAKLTSPRGFPIEEGAIVYIRKNQRKAKVGLAFQKDPKTFPAPYPPVP